MKAFLCMALAGHILCGISDYLLTYAPNGKVNLSDFKDYDKSHEAFRGMSLKNLAYAMVLGVIAMTLEIFGYLAICDYVEQFSKPIYMIMYAATLIMFISLSLHHLFCCLCEWFFVRLDLTKEALGAVWDFFQTTAYTMYAGYIAMVVFAAAFLIAVVTGQTQLPRWACVFNLLPLAVVILPTKLPAKANIIGAVMFTGLLVLI